MLLEEALLFPHQLILAKINWPQEKLYSTSKERYTTQERIKQQQHTQLKQTVRLKKEVQMRSEISAPIIHIRYTKEPTASNYSLHTQAVGLPTRYLIRFFITVCGQDRELLEFGA